MIKKGEHLEGVEPINEKKFLNKEFLEIISKKIKDKEIINYLRKLLNDRDVVDKSGYSGSSTIIIKKDNKNEKEYVLKIVPKDKLKEEFVAYNYFYKKGLTSKPIKYFETDKYELMIVEKIDYETAGNYFNNFEEISEFFGKELRKFHDMNLINDIFTNEEYKIFKEKYKNNFKEAIKNDTCLIYSSIYMNDNDSTSMQNYLKENEELLFDDLVLVHGDFNPNNIFINKDKIYFIDFKDSGFVDRHYDIFWTMFMIIIFSGILKDKKSILKCEKIFLDAYGRDIIVDKKLEYFKKFTCLYWHQHDELTRIDIV